MIIKGEKTITGEPIKKAEDFIEDLCDRINGFIPKLDQMDGPQMQLMMCRGFLDGFTSRLNRVCER